MKVRMKDHVIQHVAGVSAEQYCQHTSVRPNCIQDVQAREAETHSRRSRHASTAMTKREQSQEAVEERESLARRAHVDGAYRSIVVWHGAADDDGKGDEEDTADDREPEDVTPGERAESQRDSATARTDTASNRRAGRVLRKTQVSDACG
eukprot:2005057-Rhodomonas_salina.2